MHNGVLSRELAGEMRLHLIEITQLYVFIMINTKMQIWAKGKIPFGKDAYSKIANLLTKLPTKIVHNPSSPLAIG